MLLSHRPTSTLGLGSLVESFWYADATAADESPSGATRERALPTGDTYIIFRLSPDPIRVFGDLADSRGSELGHSVVSGARSSYYVRDVSRPACSIGVSLRPGGVPALLGVSAAELAGHHTPLPALWGQRARTLRDRLLEASSPGERLALLEREIAAWSSPSPLHPAVAHLLERLARYPSACSIGQACAETGYSQRRLIELFVRCVGLTPKVYWRVRRFQRAIAAIAQRGETSLAQIALDCGFCDQPHMNREFQALAGVSPGAYEPSSPARPNHVLVR